jgi:hypothetical protein
LPFNLNKLLLPSGKFKLSVISSTSPWIGKTGEFSFETTAGRNKKIASINERVRGGNDNEKNLK